MEIGKTKLGLHSEELTGRGGEGERDVDVFCFKERHHVCI